MTPPHPPPPRAERRRRKRKNTTLQHSHCMDLMGVETVEGMEQAVQQHMLDILQQDHTQQ